MLLHHTTQFRGQRSSGRSPTCGCTSWRWWFKSQKRDFKPRRREIKSELDVWRNIGVGRNFQNLSTMFLQLAGKFSYQLSDECRAFRHISWLERYRDICPLTSRARQVCSHLGNPEWAHTGSPCIIFINSSYSTHSCLFHLLNFSSNLYQFGSEEPSKEAHPQTPKRVCIVPFYLPL